MSNPDFDDILSTTLANYRNQLIDNIFSDRVLLWWLTKKNNVRKLDGGESIVEQLLYSQGQAGFHGEWDAITINPQDTVTAAQYDWKQMHGTIAVSNLERAKNRGKSQILDLVKAKVMQAEETMKETLNSCLFTGGVSNGFHGLAELVDATGTIGGIDSSTATWWAAVDEDASAGGGTATHALFLSRMGSAFNDAAKGNDKTDFIVTDQTTYEKYEAGLIPAVRREDVLVANAGFDTLTFKGKPFVYDEDCTADTVYGLNSKYIHLVGHSDVWFKQTKFVDGLNSANGGAAAVVDAGYSYITAYGNLTTNKRSALWKLHTVGDAA